MKNADQFPRIRELERRVANLLRIGTVETLDEANAWVTVRIGKIVTAPLQWLTHRAGPDVSWWAPEPGEQVLVLAPSGELSIGVVLPALYQTAYPAPATVKTKHRMVYADGTVVEYDRGAHKLTAAVQGTAEITTTGNAKVQSGAELRLVGATIVLDGPVSATSTIDATGDVTGQGTSLHTHVHGGVTPGGGSTGQPA